MKILSNSFYIRVIFTILLFGTCGTTSLAQLLPQNEELTGKASQLIYSDPDEAIKISQHLLKSSFNDPEKAMLNLLIAESYNVKGNYNNAVISVYEAGKYFKTINDTLKIKILLLKSALLRDLYLDSQSEKYLYDAEKITQSLNAKSVQEKFEAKIILNKIEMNLARQKNQEAYDLIRKNNYLLKNVSFENPDFKQNLTITKAKVFTSLTERDSAEYYFNEALLFSQKRKSVNFLERTIISSELGRLYFHKKEHQKSIEIILQSLEYVKKINNIPLLKSINRQLAVNYLALNDRVNHQLFNSDFLKFNNILEQTEQESVNTVFNLISKEQEYYFIDKKNKYAASFYTAAVISVIIILICLLFWLKATWKKKRLKEIINYLEISKNIFTKINTEKKESSKKIIIPAETEQAILTKLKRFESSTKFTNKEMSLAVLAGQFDTNTKYLSEIINKHYQDNFNTYINKLRINFIIQKLKTDPNYMHYKIRYLAGECGFSSHSSFATVFKSITGIAPVTFIELLKQENQETV